jgi:hypothetical protein
LKKNCIILKKQGVKFKNGCVYSKTRDVFLEVALEMVVLSNFKDEDDLHFLPKLKQSTKPTPLSPIIPFTQHSTPGSS